MAIQNFPCLKCNTDMHIDTAKLAAGQYYLSLNPRCRARFDVVPRPATPTPMVQRRETSIWEDISEILNVAGNVLGEVGKQFWQENKGEIIAGTLRYLLAPEKPKRRRRRRRSG